MKLLLGLALAMCVSAPALAVTPEQAGFYTGKITTSIRYFNVKQVGKQTSTFVMQLNLDGTTIVASTVTDQDTFQGVSVLGTNNGVLTVGDIEYILSLKGKSIKGTSTTIYSNQGDGAILLQSIKVKKAKSGGFS